MTYLTIPHPIRSLTPALMADARAVQTVLGGQWTTPEALARVKSAAARLALVAAEIEGQVKQMEASRD